jgi:hypothetical protein
LARDPIRLEEEKLPVQNRKTPRFIAHCHSHAIASSLRRLEFVQVSHRTVDERMNAFEAGDILRGEVALSFASVYAGYEDRRFCRRVTPEAQRDGVTPALRLHDFAIEPRSPQLRR